MKYVVNEHRLMIIQPLGMSHLNSNVSVAKARFFFENRERDPGARCNGGNPRSKTRLCAMIPSERAHVAVPMHQINGLWARWDAEAANR